LLAQDALPRSRPRRADSNDAGNLPTRNRVNLQSEEKACLTISPTRVHRTEAESAFLSRMKCSTGADKFNVSKERLSEAVKNVGHSAAEVERELKKLA